MFKRVLLAVMMAAAVAQARDETRTVPLAWQRAGDSRSAQVPNAKVRHARQPDGGRFVSITFADGTFCSANTLGEATTVPLTLSCGSAERYYLFLEVAGAAQLSWVGSGSIGQKGN